VIIDAWMQHPNAQWLGNPIFDSLRRWKPGKWSETHRPIEVTLAGKPAEAAFLAANARRVFRLA